LASIIPENNLDDPTAIYRIFKSESYETNIKEQSVCAAIDAMNYFLNTKLTLLGYYPQHDEDYFFQEINHYFHTNCEPARSSSPKNKTQNYTSTQVPLSQGNLNDSATSKESGSKTKKKDDDNALARNILLLPGCIITATQSSQSKATPNKATFERISWYLVSKGLGKFNNMKLGDSNKTSLVFIKKNITKMNDSAKLAFTNELSDFNISIKDYKKEFEKSNKTDKLVGELATSSNDSIINSDADLSSSIRKLSVEDAASKRKCSTSVLDLQSKQTRPRIRSKINDMNESVLEDIGINQNLIMIHESSDDCFESEDECISCFGIFKLNF